MNAHDKIKDALEKAQEKEYSNGMATEKVTIATDCGYIDVIRKCGDLEKPEIFLLIIRGSVSVSPNRTKIANILENILGIKHTDLNVVTKSRYGYENEYTCIVPVELFD